MQWQPWKLGNSQALMKTLKQMMGRWGEGRPWLLGSWEGESGGQGAHWSCIRLSWNAQVCKWWQVACKLCGTVLSCTAAKFRSGNLMYLASQRNIISVITSLHSRSLCAELHCICNPPRAVIHFPWQPKASILWMLTSVSLLLLPSYWLLSSLSGLSEQPPNGPLCSNLIPLNPFTVLQ